MALIKNTDIDVQFSKCNLILNICCNVINLLKVNYGLTLKDSIYNIKKYN